MTMGFRAEWYDRNPLVIGALTETGAVAPHGNTERARYTVPAGRCALIHTLDILATRVTAATVLGNFTSFFAISGSSARMLTLFLRDNTAGAGVAVNNAPLIFLSAGQFIMFYTNDTSTDGTAAFSGSFSGTEFDA